MPALVQLEAPPCEPGFSHESTLFVSAFCYSDAFVFNAYLAWTILFGLEAIVMTAAGVRAYRRRQLNAVIIGGVLCPLFSFLNSIAQLFQWSLWVSLITAMIATSALAIAAVTIPYRWMKGVVITHVTRTIEGQHRPHLLVALDWTYYLYTVTGPLPLIVCFFLAGGYGTQHADFPETYNKFIAAGYGWLGLIGLATAIILVFLFVALDRMLRRAQKSLEQIAPGSTSSGENRYAAIRRRVWIYCIFQTFLFLLAGIVCVALMVYCIQRDGQVEAFTYINVYVLNTSIWLITILMLVVEVRQPPPKPVSGSSGLASVDSARPTVSVTGGADHKMEPSPILQNIDMKQLSPTVEAAEEA